MSIADESFKLLKINSFNHKVAQNCQLFLKDCGFLLLFLCPEDLQ